MRVILGVIAILVLLALGVVLLLYSGTIDVAAQARPHPLLAWVVDTAQRQSVRTHARGIEVPALGEPDMVEAGARQFQTDCLQCHGAPGVEPQPFARALRPAPPDLARVVGRWTSAELFWIVKNGLAFSAMPGWGAVRVDGELWPVVAFLTQLPGMDAARWQVLTAPPAPPPAAEGEAEPGTGMVPPDEGEPAPSEGEGEPAPRP